MPINVNSHFISLILNVALPVGLGWQKFSLTKTSPGDMLLYVHSAKLHYKLSEGQVPGPWLFISYDNRYTIDFFRVPVCLCMCVHGSVSGGTMGLNPSSVPKSYSEQVLLSQNNCFSIRVGSLPFLLPLL